MPEQTFGEFLKKGEVMKQSLAIHAEELAHLEKHRLKFDTTYDRVKNLLAQQADLTAKKQEISKELGVLLTDGRQLLSFLSVAVKEHFGKRAEKLVAFGLQPFRSRPRVKVIGLDGKPVKRRLTEEQPTAPPIQEPAESTDE
ncbi:MAG TPA: hypothetical protein VKM72_00645 [Thermoanaerobaculia bacterium]|nr:hypothetical protein [Thermoanaerobaculia bacterium]